MTSASRHSRKLAEGCSSAMAASSSARSSGPGGALPGLALLLAREFTSFADVARYRDREVVFLKRAQICCGDLHGAAAGADWGQLADLDQLTAFADYKVPQVLRELGIIAYAGELAELIDRRQLLPPGSEAEVEIRAATLWGVEHLRRALADRGIEHRALELDWQLWELGQSLPAERPTIPPDSHDLLLTAKDAACRSGFRSSRSFQIRRLGSAGSRPPHGAIENSSLLSGWHPGDGEDPDSGGLDRGGRLGGPGKHLSFVSPAWRQSDRAARRTQPFHGLAPADHDRLRGLPGIQSRPGAGARRWQDREDVSRRDQAPAGL